MTEVRWLNDEELQTWMAVIGTVMKLPALLDRQLQRDAGLNHFDYGIMSALSEAPNRSVQMSSLARFANGSLSRLSHAISRLENRGWVQRSACSTDGRLTEARLTDAGWRKIQLASVGHVSLVRNLVFDALTDEDQLTLRRLAATILRRIDADGT